MRAPATAPARRWRNSPVVRELDRTRARWIWTVLFAVAIAATPFVVYLSQIMRYVETGYALEKLRGRQEWLLEFERRLRIERAFLEALPEVERKATTRLGLVRPTPDRVIVVGRGAAGPEPGTARFHERSPAVR
jgi:cell division protein FtsL